jgi:DNA-binding NarL/FixJ family response regulator
MGLVGSLEDLSLLDILQIVNVSRKTGVLRIRLDSGATYFIHFQTGAVADVVGAFDEAPFFGYFLKEGLVEEHEYNEAMARSGDKPRAALDYLVDSEILNARLVEQARRRELSARLRFLTRECRSGEFAFFLQDQDEIKDAQSPGPILPLAEPVSPQSLLSQSLKDQAIAESAPRKTASPPSEQVSAPAVPPAPAAISSAPTPGGPSGARAEVEVIHEAEAVPVHSGDALGGLPLVTPTPEAPAKRERIASAKSGLTVLLAADESIFKNLLWQRLLEHFGRVERVANLAEYISLARLLLEGRIPFVSVVDLLMPTQDGKGYLGGLEIVEQSSSRFPEVKVVLITDLLDPRMNDLARAKGASIVLQKPELARLQVGQLESAIGDFGAKICSEIEKLSPPVEEEVASFLKDLGAEAVSEGFRVHDQLSLLKGLMGELANPQESSEISLLVLRLASEYFERAILFLVKREELVGLGGFGATGDRETMIQKVRRLRIPLGVGSSVDEVLSSRASVKRLQGDAFEVDMDFQDAIGSYRSAAFVLIPMVSRNRVIAVLYADNAVTGAALPDISGMEIFMAQAGLAMEKALLERQLMTFRKGLSQKNGPDSAGG